MGHKSGKIATRGGTAATNLPRVFCIGDAAEHGKLELTPVAIQAGELLVRRLFAPELGCGDMDYDNVATTVFTPAEYGTVGLSEEEAAERYGRGTVVTFLSEFNTLEIGAAHRAMPDAFLRAMRHWQKEEGVRSSAAQYRFKEKDADE